MLIANTTEIHVLFSCFSCFIADLPKHYCSNTDEITRSFPIFWCIYIFYVLWLNISDCGTFVSVLCGSDNTHMLTPVVGAHNRTNSSTGLAALLTPFQTISKRVQNKILNTLKQHGLSPCLAIPPPPPPPQSTTHNTLIYWWMKKAK